MAPSSLPATGGEPLVAVPAAAPADPGLVALGRTLFFDTRLSADETASCATCHDPRLGGSDGRSVAAGADGVPRLFNTPTLFNAGFAARFGWRGDQSTLEDAVADAVPAELGGEWSAVIDRLSADADMTAAFPDGVSKGRIKRALAAYVRVLTTPDAPFDRWLAGESDALTHSQKRGYALFKTYGCAGCHQGRAAGGTMFQPIGLFKPFFPRHGTNPRADLGRYAVTGREADRHSFKVPTLRNVAQTAPYLHDGSVATLSGAVRVMAYYQVGRSLTEREVADIVAFLESMTAPVPPLALPPGEAPS
ncbi:cytochrome-c peroxidase [Caenispirillum salinarum]|uniref:cytochrome-c peroxidase n=1 Tax=Caenispirillum salinarum TaxID=859058 RepID=UPI00384F1366